MMKKEKKEKLSKQNRKKKTKDGRIGFFHSMSFKVMLLTIVAVLITSAYSYLVMIPRMQGMLKDSTQSQMETLTQSYAQVLNNAIYQGKIEESGYDMYDALLSKAGMKDVSSSYVYVVSEEGTMLYHPTKEKVGNAVENEVITGVVADMKTGNIPAGVTFSSYSFKGAVKYASYIILSDRSIMVLSADEDEIFQDVVNIRNRYFASLVLILVIICGLAYGASKWMIKPLQKLTEILLQTANFNFLRNPASEAICKRKDEIGVIGRATQEMRANLRCMVTDIDEVNKQITSNVSELEIISGEINNNCSDNSATTQELAAGMEETTATAETINGNIGRIKGNAEDVLEMSQEGEALSVEVKARAEELKKTTNEASERTTSLYKSVKQKTEKAIEDSKAVDKINELTEAIMAISSQTRLLALNASIEAARAGEAGRGFAVVASEIGNLANQTTETVNSINAIVGEVNGAVDSLAESLQNTIEFLEKVVLKDYDQFATVGQQYDADAGQFGESMNKIEAAVTELTATIMEIAGALNGITDTVNESTIGVTDIAEKTSEVVGQTVMNTELVHDCIKTVEKLQQISEMFVLES